MPRCSCAWLWFHPRNAGNHFDHPPTLNSSTLVQWCLWRAVCPWMSNATLNRSTGSVDQVCSIQNQMTVVTNSTFHVGTYWLAKQFHRITVQFGGGYYLDDFVKYWHFYCLAMLSVVSRPPIESEQCKCSAVIELSCIVVSSIATAVACPRAIFFEIEGAQNKRSLVSQ